MIYNLISIYDDELLTSFIQRYYNQSGDNGFTNTFRILFGSESNIVNSAIPNNLINFCDRISYNQNVGIENFIEKHTLFNFYTAFTSMEFKNTILEKMKLKSSNAYKAVRYNEIIPPKYMKYCPECMNEQLKKYGEYYFDRSQQLGLICIKHSRWLINSNIAFTLTKQYKYHDKIHEYRGKGGTNDNLWERSRSISDRIQKLVQIPISISYKEMRDIYIKKFEDYGFMTPSKASCKISSLKKEMVLYFGEKTLKYILKEKDIDNNDKFISKLIYKHNNSTHPIYHILMQEFLKVDPYGIVSKLQEENNLLTIKCYCQNKLSKHYSRQEIKDIKAHYCYDTKQYMCTFSCNCGYVFTTNLEDVYKSNGTRVGKVKAFGEEYVNNLIELSKTKGIKTIARITGINVNTVRKQLKKYAIYGTIEPQINLATPTNKYGYKIKGEKLWLEKRWMDKDNLYLQKTQEVIDKEFNKKTRPTRLTKTRIAKAVGAVHAIMYCSDNLPKTIQLISAYQENRQQYMIRKIQWSIDELVNQGKDITPWKIMQVGGFSTYKYERLFINIQEVLSDRV